MEVEAQGEAPFADAVAERCGSTPEEVLSALGAHGIRTAASPPPTAHLRLARIAFKGTKTVQDVTVPIDFEWNPDADGLWGIATEENLVGKTSLIQIVLWALRGTPKHLSKTVRGWLQSVEAAFYAGSTRVDVRFDVAAGSPKGEVRVGGEAIAQSFWDDEMFARTMEDVMLGLLGLTRIPASQTTADGGIHEYEDGWTAYTLAFLSDTDSDAIIGEFHGTDFTGRLLQVFVGLPWAMTLFQIRARQRRLAEEAVQRKRKISALGGHSVNSLEAALADVASRIDSEAARNRSAQDLLEAQSIFTRAREHSRQLYDRWDELRFLAISAKDARVEAERALLALREENVATTFLHRLKPVCCPRCSAAIDEERRQREAAEHRCSVCDTIVDEPDVNALAGAIANAELRVKDARSHEQDANAAADEAKGEVREAERERDAADITLQRLGALGKAGDLQRLEGQRARLEGMLEIARLVQGADLADEASLSIMKAAEEEADSRVRASSEEILARASHEIARIARELGMRDVESVKLTRAAHVRVSKGGSVSNWSELAAGEQLRLRIATVVALVRTAREHGVGRHPGLLFVDSPGREEVQDQNLGDMLGELARLADETPDLQVFVAMRGIEAAERAIGAERLLAAGLGATLW